VISAFNSLTLSPALAAILLQPHGAKRDILAILLNVTLGWFFKLFNGVFSVGTTAYTNIVAVMLRVSLIVLMVYVGLLYATYWSFAHTPTGFIPAQDKGYLLLNVQLPDSASVSRTREVMKQLEAIASSIEGVEHTVSLSGQSLLLGASASNFGSMNVILKPFEDRKGLSSDSIGASISERCRREVKDAAVGVFGPPAIDGLGNAGGFKMMIEDRGPLGLAELQKTADAIVAKGNSTPGLTGLFTSSRSGTPWLQLDIDRDKCLSMGVQLGDVFSSLQIFFGSYYVNNFNEFGRSWQLNLMADSQFRYHIEDLQRIKVRNMQGQMVPLGTMINVRDGYGPVMLTRYNMYSASAVYGAPSPGTSSGESIDLMNGIADGSLPSAMSTEWSELTYLQLQAGNTAMVVFALAVVFVFLVLAAQYESWSLPLAVILVVPMCLLCSVIGVRLSGNDINIFTQIGFVVLVGLASKNAILIVEFAKQQREEGKSRREAVLEACRLRLRPILMTSFAFILGVVPLVVATGAGAEMRRTLGLAVFSGMLGVTVFGVFLTPVFFYVIQWFGDGKPAPEVVASATSDHSGHHHS
jgi:hydrophobe/amphiphile efflux-1 (HAE1) family protein